jgi:hypothetical protein
VGYYENYRHSTNGLLVLDERGFDRLVFGDPVPDPNIGRRIAPSTGIVINDDEGFEWSGYGLLTVDDKKRVVLGLDSHDGEAVTLSVFESGRRGLSVYSPTNSMFLGKAPASAQVFGLDEEMFGLVLREGETITRLPGR